MDIKPNAGMLCQGALWDPREAEACMNVYKAGGSRPDPHQPPGTLAGVEHLPLSRASRACIQDSQGHGTVLGPHFGFQAP